MIHQSKESEAYQHMLTVLKDSVQSHAESLLHERSKPRYQESGSQAMLLSHCFEVSEDGFSPAFMMIDGDDSERLAIEIVFPGVPIRLCQFHFMQACISRIQSVFGRTKAGTRKTNKVVRSLRKLQRCPIESEWLSSYQIFKNDIDSVANDGGRALASLVQYFDRSWFSPVWRPYCIDYGIPIENTRDGPWSTNNYAEAAFRVFDRVFLCCRVNKRCVRTEVGLRGLSLNNEFNQARPPAADHN